MPTGVYLRTKPAWSKGKKGFKRSEEFKLKMKNIAKNNGYGKWMKGRKMTLKTRIKMSENNKGSKNHFWKGGLLLKNAIIRKSFEYRLWREAVFQRDNYTCVWCKTKSGNGKTVILNADHIKPFYSYPKLRFNLNNGRTLCVECHRKTNTWGRPKKYVSKNDFETIKNPKEGKKRKVKSISKV